MKRAIPILLAAIMLLCACAALTGCDTASHELIYDVSDLAGARMGVIAGTTFDEYTDTYIADAQKFYFDDYADMAAAVEQGKLDGFLMDEPLAGLLLNEDAELDTLDEALTHDSYAFALPKTDRGLMLRDEMDEYLKRIKSDGTLDELVAIWFGGDVSRQTVDYSGLTGENGTVTLITASIAEPFVYYCEGELVGYDLDIIVRFCREKGYALEILDVEESAVLVALATGKGDIAANCIAVTPERAESLYFTEPDYEGGIVAVISAARKGAAAYTTLHDLAGKTIGVTTGTRSDQLAKEQIPDCRVSYFQAKADMILALTQGKIDAYIADEPNARYACAADPDSITTIAEPIANDNYGFGFCKDDRGADLSAQMNEYLAKIKANGELEKMDAAAFDLDDTTQPSYVLPKPDGGNGTVSVLIYDANPPFAYVLDGRLVGYEVDILYGFCEEYGYGLRVQSSNFAGLIPGVQKYDIVSGAISITEERKESMYFSDPYYEGGIVAVVAVNGGAQEKIGFFESVVLSFEKNFIREDRWKMILSGLGVTLLIAVASAIIGTAAGFGICMLRRSRKKAISRAAAVFIRIIQGTPIVVLLMITYYVVFADSAINAIYVAIIGFSINFGVYVAEMMRMGLDAVPLGQTEAARALGFNKYQTFRKVVFPQAAKHFLPVYQGEFISMVKMTSVVGYIAIQDLTKVSDIIRSRTYEAFFPLIATAAIYFAISYIFVFLLTRLEVRIDPKRRKRKAAKA